MRSVAFLSRATALALCVVSAQRAAAQIPVARQVAAPASDILSGLVRLPDPASTPSISYASMLPLHFARTANGEWSAELTLPVERDGSLALALLGPSIANWKLLAGPLGSPLRSLDQIFACERRIGFIGDELPGWVVDRRDLRGTPAGTWSVRIESNERRAPSEGWLFASTGSDLRAEAFVTTQRLVSGEPIGIAARVVGSSMLAVERARVVLESEDMTRESAMFDDGAHEDGSAGDGLFGALVPEELLGRVRATVELAGATRDGHEFMRCAQVAFPVLGPRLALDGTAETSLVDDEHLRIALGAVPRGSEQRLHVSAEVWGQDAAGESVPVCWLSRMLDPESHAGAWELPLVLDLRWLDVADAFAPLELRQVRVQDPDTESVLDFADFIEPTAFVRPVAPRHRSREIAPEMLTGVSATTIGATLTGVIPPPFSNLSAKRALMLVHGYCSSGSIWPAADFAQPKLEFLDPNANRSHDQFAQLIAQRAQAAHLTSFGVVAHSQGGPAALHLLTYYLSGLDQSFGGRRIQSLAAPFQGTPLASLGGFACGVNNDMTPAGSATWLAGIPSWARAEVYTFTTSNSGSACNAFTNFFLTDPEDGTVEKMRAELPGGNNLGHTLGWCHTTGMTNPASYTDHTRNQSMNTAASR